MLVDFSSQFPYISKTTKSFPALTSENKSRLKRSCNTKESLQWLVKSPSVTLSLIEGSKIYIYLYWVKVTKWCHRTDTVNNDSSIWKCQWKYGYQSGQGVTLSSERPWHEDLEKQQTGECGDLNSNRRKMEGEKLK